MFRFSALQVLAAAVVAVAVPTGTLLEPIHIFVLQDTSSELQRETTRMLYDATKTALFATDVKIMTLLDRTTVPFSTRMELDQTGQSIECYKWATAIGDLARNNDRLFRWPVAKHIIFFGEGSNCTTVDYARFTGRGLRMIGVFVDAIHTGGNHSERQNASSVTIDFAVRPFYTIDLLLGPVMAVSETTDQHTRADSTRHYVQSLYDASVAFDELYRTLTANSSVEKLTPKVLRLQAVEEARRPLAGERFLFGFLTLCLIFLTVILTLLCTITCAASALEGVHQDHFARAERLPHEDAQT